jgi:hypothetical protein
VDSFGGRWRKKGKKKIEIGKFTKKTLSKVMSLTLTDLVYHVSLTMGPDVRNRVKPAKNANQCTLERIRSKSLVFCNFAEYRWFCVFPAQMW